MKILPIDSNYKPSFNARLPKKEVMALIEIAKKIQAMPECQNYTRYWRC